MANLTVILLCIHCHEPSEEIETWRVDVIQLVASISQSYPYADRDNSQWVSFVPGLAFIYAWLLEVGLRD